MLNRSKINSTRHQGKMRDSGAYHTPQDAQRNKTRRHFRKMWNAMGNLSTEEIDRLLDLELGSGPIILREQVERYGLQLKVGEPEKAERMMDAADELFERGISGDEDVRNLCNTIGEYHPGIFIHYGGYKYSINSGKLVRRAG